MQHWADNFGRRFRYSEEVDSLRSIYSIPKPKDDLEGKRAKIKLAVIQKMQKKQPISSKTSIISDDSEIVQ